MRRLFIINIITFISVLFAWTQQSPIYSQYLLNEFIINPSVAGLDGMTTINFTGRKQWLGWTNAPETYSASVSSRILKSPIRFLSKNGKSKVKKGASGKVGVGASATNDRNGAIIRTNLNFTYAYHIDINEDQLSFGLSFLALQFKIDHELAQLVSQSGDPLEGLIGKSSYIPDGAFGISYSSSNFNIGLSAFQLFESPVKFNGQKLFSDNLPQVRHYHLIGNYLGEFAGNEKWEYEPSLIVRTTENFSPSADISVRFIYKKEYWAGLSVRTSKDFIALMGLKLNRLYFGYSFDYGFNEVSRLTYGSHEAFLAIKLGDSTRRYRYRERY